MEIQLTTRLFQALEEYPELEEKVMEMAPVFRNLTNPVLRKTVGRIATIEQVARVGKLDPGSFLNDLRREAGLPPLEDLPVEEIPLPTGAPDWLKGTPIEVIDGSAMLAEGEHPLGLVNELMQKAVGGEYLLLTTSFQPIPLLEAMEKQDYLVYHLEEEGDHRTFVGKR